MVKILYFARLREQLGIPGESIVLPAGVSTVGALRDHLVARGGEWADALGGNRPVRAAINHDMALADAQVQDGDEIAFFPPVTGG